MKGRIVCRLYIGGEIIKEQKTKQQREKALDRWYQWCACWMII